MVTVGAGHLHLWSSPPLSAFLPGLGLAWLSSSNAKMGKEGQDRGGLPVKQLQGVQPVVEASGLQWGRGWWNGLWSWAGACFLGPSVPCPYTGKRHSGPSIQQAQHTLGGAWKKAELPWLGEL